MSAPTELATCERCSSPLAPGAAFCAACGSPVVRRAELPVGPAVGPPPERFVSAPPGLEALSPALQGCHPGKPGRRLWAAVIDGLIAALFGVGAGALLVVTEMVWPAPVVAGLGLIYALVMWGWLARQGRTVGKRAMGLRLVRTQTGQVPGWGASLGRALLAGVGNSVLVPWIIAIVGITSDHATRRTWYDKLAGLIVLDVAAGKDPSHVPDAAPGTPAVMPPGPPSATASPFASPVPTDTLTRARLAGQWGPAGSPGQGVPMPPSPVQASPVQASPVPPSPVQASPVPALPVPIAPAPPSPSVPPPPPPAPYPAPQPGEMITVVPGIAPGTASGTAPGTAAGTGQAGQAPDAGASFADMVRVAGENEVEEESTRRRAPDHPRHTVLAFDTLERIEGDQRGLVGRNPVDRPGDEPHAVLLCIDDPARSVSKTHFEFAPHPSGVWITDRGSTNGTLVISPDGTTTRVGMQEPVLAVTGAQVRFGDRVMRVE